MDADATARPRFKAGLEPVFDTGDGLLLLSEHGNDWLQHPLFAALAPLLDGTHDVEAIFGALSSDFPSTYVLAALDHLRACGYLAEDACSAPKGDRAFWELTEESPSTALARLHRHRVSIETAGNVESGTLRALLQSEGVAVVPAGDLTVFLVDDYLHPSLREQNDTALKTDRPWLLAKPVGQETWIGPLFVPGTTACWACLAHRLSGHRKVGAYIARRRGLTGYAAAPPARFRPMQAAAIAETAAAAVHWAGTGGRSPLLDTVLSTDIVTMQRRLHTLIRRPQCPACGSTNAASGDRILRLQPRRKVDRSDGGHRVMSPEAALARLERHLSPITGVIADILAGERTAAPHPDGPWLAGSFQADHNFSDLHDERYFLREGMRRRSGGKGKSRSQARISALAESLERYCGVFDGTEPSRRGSFAQLGAAAIDPNTCMGYSDTQYAQRDQHNRRLHKAHFVPERFQPDAVIDWTPIRSLISDDIRYLPTSFCYYGYRTQDPLFARADSNGCAAGLVPEEAVLQGLLELLERDAVAIWWYNRLQRPAVDLDSVDDPYVSALRQHYNSAQRELWALDISNDFGVPTFAAVSRRVDKAEEDIIYGFGAHLDPAVALSRALTEMNQSLEAVPAPSGPASHQTYLGETEQVQWLSLIHI